MSERMLDTYDKLSAEIEMVQQIAIVPTMLEVICKSTGMGFSAIARVTKNKWIACSVRDEIAFGLVAGGELQLETTICNEIRDSHKAVVIDHVANDIVYRDHHTPLMYKFQSYISVPIFLKNGEFFGTLCAIDPNPASLNNAKTIGMFELFAELISFHLESLELMERSRYTLHSINRQLTESIEENRQYQHISNHNLQEPLRKIRLFSNMLLNAVEVKNEDKTKDLAAKIDHNAKKVSMMIKDLSGFSELNTSPASFEQVVLNKVVADVCVQLEPELSKLQAVVNVGALPQISGIPFQLEQLFFQLLHNAIQFSRPDVPLVISIEAATPTKLELLPSEKVSNYVEVRITDNGIGIENEQLEKIFDIFSQLDYSPTKEGFGVGLAYCRKIVRNHKGQITAQSEPGAGTTFSLIFPIN